MLYIGTQITAIGDTLTPISEEELLTRIHSQNTFVQQLTEQLRIIRSVDEKQYAIVKKKLPYVVCGHFNPAVRRLENFAYIESFVVDIDHIVAKGLNIEELKQKFRRDERVMLCFVSPSQDGLKLLFRLSERCCDAGVFSVFYKEFVLQLSKQYGLEQVIDAKTSDVTRACFISYDKEAYYNPLADAVVLSEYVRVDSTVSLFDQKIELEKQENCVCPDMNLSKKVVDPTGDALARIKEILLQKKSQQNKPQVYVPEEVNVIMEQLKDYLQTMNIQTDAVADISYGKKLRTSVGIVKAETNIFYGKRGYSVVVSPKSGTSAEFNQMVAELIKLFLNIQ